MISTIQSRKIYLLVWCLNIKIITLYKTIILPVVLYECETWSLPLREEPGLRVFENRVLRRIFVLKADEVTGGWRKLHHEELHNLYSSPSTFRIIKSRRMRLAGHVARIERIAYTILMGILEGNRTLGRPRRRWVNNIKIDLRGVERGGTD
jgi:hypothetical protein